MTGWAQEVSFLLAISGSQKLLIEKIYLSLIKDRVTKLAPLKSFSEIV
jgi:hypothetical protein